MKSLITAATLAALLTCLPGLALAAQQHRDVSLDQKAMLGSQQLKPGQYTLKWDDNSANTNVTFEQNGKTVATAPATIVKKNNPGNASYEFNTSSGQNRLDRVYLSHEELVFGTTSTNTEGSSQKMIPPSQ